MTIRIALVGCGAIADVHARALAAHRGRAELVVAVDRELAAADKLVAGTSARATDSYDEVLASDDVDAVVICTPSGTHAALAVRALDAGKHVLIEKPLDVSLEAALTVLAAERRSGKVASVISQHRFDPSTARVREALQSGGLGSLTSAVVSVAWYRTPAYFAAASWRGTYAFDGGGALINQSIHTLDLMVWLFGAPVEAFAWNGRLVHTGIEAEDTLVGTVRFAGGALATVHATTAAYPGLTARLQVHGTNGSAVIEDDQLRYLHLGAPDAEIPLYGLGAAGNQLGSDGTATADSAGTPSTLGVAHTAQWDDFLSAIETGRPSLSTVTDAIVTLGVVRALYDSAELGQPVPLAPLR